MSITFRPTCLPFSEWPKAHRRAWETALAPKDILDTENRSVEWRPASVVRNRKAYGVWLAWNIWKGKDIAESRPEQLVTRAEVKAFVGDLQGVNASYTVRDRIQALYSVMLILAPPCRAFDWNWLSKGMMRLNAIAIPSRNKLSRLKSAPAIEALGFQLMVEADKAEKTGAMTLIERALCYRDGLMIALLIHRPLRLSNFAALALDTTIVMLEDKVLIAIPANLSKNKRRNESEFPHSLMAPFHRYLEVYRPILESKSVNAQRNAGPAPLQALWVSRGGAALDPESIKGAIKRRTKLAFRKHIPPHLFRDVVATTLIQDTPASARLASGVLGHSDMRITEKHYDQSLMIHNGRRHGNLVASFEQNILPDEEPSWR